MTPAQAPGDDDAVPLSAWADQWRPAATGRQETITAGPAAALAGLFDQPAPTRDDGDPLPPLWHWLHFLDVPAESDLGPDGHPRHSGFLPPIPRRRRMFAGGRMTVTAPLRIGERATRESRVARVRATTGRSGELLFVTEEHTYGVDGHPRVTEQLDLVYRRAPASATDTPAPPTDAPAPPPPDERPDPWRLRLTPTPVLLFRFSALTYNAHRIHYDHPYATEVEGFPGLVVHGPLLAIALLELPRRLGRTVRHYEFRLRRPCFAGHPVLLTGTPSDSGADLRVDAPGARPAVTARAEFATP